MTIRSRRQRLGAAPKSASIAKSGEPERLAFTHAWVRANGTLTVRRSSPRPSLARRQDRGDLPAGDFATAAACQSHEEGWGVSLDQLVGYGPVRSLRAPAPGTTWPRRRISTPARPQSQLHPLGPVGEADVKWFDAHLAADFFNTNPDGVDRRAAFRPKIGAARR